MILTRAPRSERLHAMGVNDNSWEYRGNAKMQLVLFDSTVSPLAVLRSSGDEVTSKDLNAPTLTLDMAFRCRITASPCSSSHDQRKAR